jgi:hypothetical protein
VPFQHIAHEQHQDVGRSVLAIAGCSFEMFPGARAAKVEAFVKPLVDAVHAL